MVKLTGFSISQEVLNWINQNIPQGSTILELGSGAGTYYLSKSFNMFSVEHDKFFVNQYDSNYIHAPIKHGWYDTNCLLDLPEYDVLLIDGPTGTIGRWGVVKNAIIFDWNKIIIVDDTHRAEELKISDWVKRQKKKDPIIIKGSKKEAHIYL